MTIQDDQRTSLHGEAKKEAFRKAAEAKIKSFSFERLSQELEDR